MFTELAEKAVENKPYLEFTEAYARLAVRAQANCRASLEAIVRSDRSRALAQRLEAAASSDRNRSARP